jgi:uridine kinase
MSAPRLIGIAGGTGAGKSAMVRTVAARLGGCVIDVDAYYLDRRGLSAAARAEINYDEPAAIDAELLVEHLTRLARGETVERPVYSFETHTRTGSTPVRPGDLVIVEGLFTFWWDAVRARLGLKIFVDAPADVRLARRLRRDVSERGRTTDHVLRQYLTTVRPMHERYVEPCRGFADLVIQNDGAIAEATATLLAAVVRDAARPNVTAAATTPH